jgi:hypothetical protein
MAIKPIQEPDIHLPQEEIDRLRYEYVHAFQNYSGRVPSFETWVRGRIAKESSND